MNRWILEMMEYNYEIQYLRGKYNVVADQLSRPVRIIHCAPEPNILGLSKEAFKERQREEGKCKEMAQYLEGELSLLKIIIGRFYNNLWL